MFIFFKLALGNLIKNRRNSITILIVVFVCVFFMEFGTAYMDGFKVKITDDFLKQTGHIKLYNSEYYKDLEFSMVEYNMEYNEKAEAAIKSIPGVQNVMAEINFGALANTETKNLECFLKAIDLKGIDANYAGRKKMITEGRFIASDKEIVLGYKAAKSLKVKPGDKLIVLSVNQYGSANAVEGTVVGLSKTNNAMEDERMLVCGLGLAQKLLEIPGRVTEITVNISDPFAAEPVSVELQKTLPKEIIAVPWQKGQSFIVAMLKMLDIGVYAIAFILIFAASLGIINSFLMNIMNRMPEFGVLRAMGVGKAQIFMMILTESLMLGFTGTVAALIPGSLVVLYFQANPFNYENIWKMMQGSALGAMDASMATVLVPASVFVIFLTGILISVIASVYPAMVAVKKKPSEILRVLE